MRAVVPALLAAVLPLSARSLTGQSFDTFPLPASAGDTTPVESTAPFAVPLRLRQTRVVDRAGAIALGLPSSLTQWDQIAFDPTSRYLCVTAEQSLGAAVFRVDTATGALTTLMRGDGSGVRAATPAGWSAAADDFRNLDTCLRTPWGTLLVAEEADGGRLFEIMNPFAASGPFVVRWRSKFPAVTFEGARIDAAGVVYFSDEDNSGSIYKFVPTVAGDLAAGQVFVLRVDAWNADPRAQPDRNWDSSVNRPVARFGPATWVPMTDAAGNPLTATTPFAWVTTTGGRFAADELRATPFGRCEDMDIGVLANGREVLYSTLTNETRVLSIELVSATTAVVRVFVDFDTVNLATGIDVNPAQGDPYAPPGPGTTFNDPDNVAVDAFGSVYIVEDAAPGDIWKAVDADRDGVAEAIGLFASLGVAGAEPSGLVFDPNDPYRAVCNVLGPSSGNSALWSFRARPYPGSRRDLRLRTGVDAAGGDGPGELVKTMPGGHRAVMLVDSPAGTLTQAPYALLVQTFYTAGGVQPLLPSLWLNPVEVMLLLAGGNGALLPAGGSATSVPVPAGLLGWSAMVQALAVAADGALVLSDAHEYVLR